MLAGGVGGEGRGEGGLSDIGIPVQRGLGSGFRV